VITSGIYLDNNATTAVDERVLEAMLVPLREAYGNPSSAHQFGEDAARLLEHARASVARLAGARSPAEIVFTSGGTESINTAFQAVLGKTTRGLALTGPTEHSAVLRALEGWHELGIELQLLQVGPDGRIRVEEVLDRIAALGSDLALLSLHWANNETGVTWPRQELVAIAEACRAQEVRFHLDAVQIAGKEALELDGLGVDLASLSAHKFHGPKGAGALYVRSGRLPDPFSRLIAGGPQERERRAGTQNVPGIVGLGRAAELAAEHVADEAARLHVRELRDRLEHGLLEAVPRSRVNGAGAPRLDNTTNLLLPDVDGELLLMSLAAEGLAISTGSACSAETRAPSHVLQAMGLTDGEAASSIRLSLSRMTTAAEVEQALSVIPRVVAELRALEAV
jgi:cysteine desulfurase